MIDKSVSVVHLLPDGQDTFKKPTVNRACFCRTDPKIRLKKPEFRIGKSEFSPSATQQVFENTFHIDSKNFVNDELQKD